jgi:ATP-binding protein involved in chromosome partitioning
MFEKLDTPILGIVENMSYFICPNCNIRHEIFGSGGAERAADELCLPLLGRIPIDTEIREGGDRGMPILKSSPDSPQSAAFRELAANVAARLSVLAAEAGTRIELPVL